jgi:hypothetical protein
MDRILSLSARLPLEVISTSMQYRALDPLLVYVPAP